VGRPSDIAGLISFLAGPDGEFMTGSYLLMDGGIRDARAPEAQTRRPRVQEAMRHMAAGAARGSAFSRSSTSADEAVASGRRDSAVGRRSWVWGERKHITIGVIPHNGTREDSS
jgi:hypothetical protein